MTHNAMADYVRALGQHLEETAAFGRQLVSAQGDSPKLNSQGASEIETAGGLGADSVVVSFQTAAVSLSAANQLVDSLARLFCYPTPLYGYDVMTRAVIEAAGRAWWLLDPEIGARRRYERSLTDRLYSATETDKMIHAFISAPKLGAEILSNVPDAGFFSHVDDLLSHGRDSGLSPIRSRDGKPLHFGEPRPDSTRLAKLFLADCGMDTGEGLFRQLSGVVHSTLNATLTQYTFEEDPIRPGIGVGTPTVDTATLWVRAWAADNGYQTALRRQAVMCGWDINRVDSIRRTQESKLHAIGRCHLVDSAL